jgi:hypothetical protein
MSLKGISMNKEYDFSSYQELKKTQGYIIDEDFEPKVIDNVLLQENIDFLYNNLNGDKEIMQEWGGRKSWGFGYNKSLVNRLNEVANNNFGPGLKLNEHFFIRYTLDYGFQSKLFPHWDSRDSQRITMDIQLNADEDWGVVVEGQNTVLSYNQALIFAGTQQVHWRENKLIRPGSVVDMLVCNFEWVPDRPFQEDHAKKMEERSMFLIEKTGIGNKNNPISYE